MYVIDGHNLVPKIPDLSLAALDDEAALLNLLQQFARVRRKKIEVFFDGAPPGQAREQNLGMVRAHFVTYQSEADEAIRIFLSNLGKAARSVTVVSSDHKVQGYAREHHAPCITSEAFQILLRDAEAQDRARSAAKKGKAAHPTPGAGEPGSLGDWYQVFGIDEQQAEKPIEIKPEKKVQKPKTGKQRRHHGFEKKG